MSNFHFVQVTLPAAHDDCVRAESYLSTDPRSACCYAGRAAEKLVWHLYDVWALPVPDEDGLAARADAAAFQARAGRQITRKLNVIREVAHHAKREEKLIASHRALQVVRELHHLMVWAGFGYSAHPRTVPTEAQFDPMLAPRAAPRSGAEEAERDHLVAAGDAELVGLRERIEEAQAANMAAGRVDDHDYAEAETRDLAIELMLNEAGWPLAQEWDRDYELTGISTSSTGGADGAFVDYVLWGSDGLPLALVEARQSTVSQRAGQQQATLCADYLEKQFGRRPVIFCTDGYQQWLWDDAGGYPPRAVAGFYAADELELVIERRRSRLSLPAVAVNADIVDRVYQARAIQAVDEAFERLQREALLVMAAGSGGTRTVIALVDQLIRAGWVSRVLFLTDRAAQVNRMADRFKAQLPVTTTVNLITGKSRGVSSGGVYLSTYPAIMSRIDAMSSIEGDRGLPRLGPGHFDLIVIDEAHSAVAEEYGGIFDWFDAMMVGLTATPKEGVAHSIYRLFGLEDGVPTDAYNLDEAASDGYLVAPRRVALTTATPSLDATDLVLAALLSKGYKVAGGDRLGKTIIFAEDREQAELIERRLNTQYPEYRGGFACAITPATERAWSLIENFSNRDAAPYIAISVDMLDFDLDVPEVVNLVFFQKVSSPSKFWQMIGRGTRLCPELFGPGEDKRDFLVFDSCSNLEHFGLSLPEGSCSQQMSLSQRLFEARLGLLAALDAAEAEVELRGAVARWLQEVVAGMNPDNLLVRPHRQQVETWSRWTRWASVSAEDAAEILEGLAGLPSTVREPDEDARYFDLLIVCRQLAQLGADTVVAERIRQSVQAIAADLLTRRVMPPVAEQIALLEEIAADPWWLDATLPMLEDARLQIRDLVRFAEQ